MSNSKKYSNELFDKYPKLILVSIFCFMVFLALFITELYLEHRNGQAIDKKGKLRYLVLKEAIPNVNATMADQILSLDLSTSSLADTSQFRGDQNGFILPSFEQPNPDFSIVFLGDASSASLHLNPKDRFPYQTGQLLNGKSKYSINSYNAGYPGNDVIHSTNRLTNVILPLRPKMIVLMLSINDLVLLSRNMSYWGDPKDPKVKTFELQENSLLDFISLSKVRRYIGGSIKAKSAETVNQVTPDTALIYSNYQSALSTFITVCQDWHIIPILISQPLQIESSDLWQRVQRNNSINLSKREFISIHHGMNLISKELATAYGVNFIDLNQELSNEPGYFNDFINLSAEGSRKAATIVSDSISLWIGDWKFRNSNEKLTTIN